MHETVPSLPLQSYSSLLSPFSSVLLPIHPSHPPTLPYPVFFLSLPFLLSTIAVSLLVPPLSFPHPPLLYSVLHNHSIFPSSHWSPFSSSPLLIPFLSLPFTPLPIPFLPFTPSLSSSLLFPLLLFLPFSSHSDKVGRGEEEWIRVTLEAYILLPSCIPCSYNTCRIFSLCLSPCLSILKFILYTFSWP